MSENKTKLNGLHYVTGVIILALAIFWLFFAFKNTPLSYNEMMKKAKTYAEKGQVAFAAEEYKKLLRLYPENYDMHLNLAELYEKINETNQAKVEYIMAIRLGHKHRTEAYTKLAKIYCRENKYSIAEDVIKDIKKTKDKTALEAIGNIYFDWGETLKATDRPNAIRKFKEAGKYYKKARNKSEKLALNNIAGLYADIADELLGSKKHEEAVEVLKLSLDYRDNALARYKLAKIYEKRHSEQKALEEYSKVFKTDPGFAGKNSYITLLLKKAGEAKAQGDKIKAEYYYRKAKKLDSGLDVPLNPDNSILFSLVATKVNEDLENDLLVPGITFKLINITPDIIDNLRVKVVFLRNEKPISTQVFTIADKENALKGDSESPEINAYSNAPVKHVYDEHNLRVQIYISHYSPDKWKLFRNIRVIRGRKPVRIKEV